MFQDGLGRPIDLAGFQFWAPQMAAGTLRHDIALSILTSNDGRAVTVVRAYQQLLGRNPDAGSLSFWVGALQGGMSEQEFAAELLSSTEYLNRFRS